VLGPPLNVLLPGRPIVLCYHAVSPTSSYLLALPPRQLIRQLRSILWRGYRPVTAHEALEGRGRLLHVTFDDAFRNIASVLPELARLRVPVTVFACSGFAETGAPLVLPELAIDEPRDLEGLATMSWAELRALSQEEVVEIGSHAITHPHLPALTDAELARELRESRARIEEEVGRPCRFLAYPYGEYDSRVQAAARDAGYAAAFAVDSARGDRYAAPRVDLHRSDNILYTTVKTTPAARWTARRLRRMAHAAGIKRRSGGYPAGASGRLESKG
jgi:peptidoglycan/xylan/chitin deacetylase (PgdA/CDA1 family)